MGPVHYLSYSFIYLVAVAAREQIAFLTQRKAVSFIESLHSKSSILSCLLYWILGMLQQFHKRKHMQKLEPQVRSHWGLHVVACTFLDTDLCIMLLLCMESYSWRQ